MMRCSLVTTVMTTGDLFKERQDFTYTYARCHTSYVTRYDPVQEEDCEEKFKKTCYIEYEQKAYSENVQVCIIGCPTRSSSIFQRTEKYRIVIC